MHADLRDALAAAEADEARALPRHHRRRPRLLVRAGSDRGAPRRSRRQDRFRRAARPRLQPAGAPPLHLSQADHRGAQRARGRRRRQPGARLRHHRGGALGLSAGGVRPHRARAGCRRHLVPAAHRRAEACACARCSPPIRCRPTISIAWGSSTRCSPTREFVGETMALARRIAAGPTYTLRPDQGGGARERRTTTSRRSSISSATCSARPARAAISPKARRRSARSGRRASRGADAVPARSTQFTARICEISGSQASSGLRAFRFHSASKFH